MDSEYRRTLERAISSFGMEPQEKMVLEEMAELQKEICKRWRGKENLPELAEEIADLEITLDQLKIMHRLEAAVETCKREKVERLECRVRKHQREMEKRCSICGCDAANPQNTERLDKVSSSYGLYCDRCAENMMMLLMRGITCKDAREICKAANGTALSVIQMVEAMGPLWRK